MKLFISMRVIENTGYPERRDAISQDWWHFFSAIDKNIILIPVPNDPNITNNLIQNITVDAVVLTGGNDWGEAPERDSTEHILWQHALNKNIPLLGVCRGLQAINILHGGGISKVKKKSDHVGVRHQIKINSNAFPSLKKILNVNSFHNMGVQKDQLGKDLISLAYSEDDFVEAIRHESKPIFAIQWHPERERPFRIEELELIGNFLRKTC